MIRILLAAAQVEPGGQRQLMAVVARQIDRDDMRIVGGERLHHRPAAVARAVVDQHDLIILAGTRWRRGREPLVQLGEARLLVVAGHDDRQRWSSVQSIED